VNLKGTFITTSVSKHVIVIEEKVRTVSSDSYSFSCSGNFSVMEGIGIIVST